jgi:hypothetical protein
MALAVMRITRDPTGAIGIGLTDVGTTIEIVSLRSPIHPRLYAVPILVGVDTC